MTFCNDRRKIEVGVNQGEGSFPDCFCNLEHKAAFQEEFVLTGANPLDTITLEDETLVSPTAEPSPFGIPRVVWHIASGTSVYAGISGHGTGYLDPPATLFLDGLIQMG